MRAARRNSDEEIRRRARAAASGDVEAWNMAAVAALRAGQYPPPPPWIKNPPRFMSEEEIRWIFEEANRTRSRVEATWKPGYFFQYGYFRDWPPENVSREGMPYWSMSRFYVGRSTGRRPVLLQLANRSSSGGDVLGAGQFVHARILRRAGHSRWVNNNPAKSNPAEDDGRYRFVHSCPGAESGKDIQLLCESERQITRQTFARKLAPGQWEWIQRELGYDRYLPISSADWQIGYYKGVYRGVKAVFLDWSAMEYIFTLDGKLGPSVSRNADERSRRAAREGRSEDELREAIRRGEIIGPDEETPADRSAYWFNLALAGWTEPRDDSIAHFMARVLEEFGRTWVIKLAPPVRPDWPWWAQPEVQAEVRAFLARGMRSPPWPPSANPDEEIRRLERQAQTGDEAAKAKLQAMRMRAGVPPGHEPWVVRVRNSILGLVLVEATRTYPSGRTRTWRNEQIPSYVAMTMDAERGGHSNLLWIVNAESAPIIRGERPSELPIQIEEIATGGALVPTASDWEPEYEWRVRLFVQSPRGRRSRRNPDEKIRRLQREGDDKAKIAAWRAGQPVPPDMIYGPTAPPNRWGEWRLGDRVVRVLPARPVSWGGAVPDPDLGVRWTFLIYLCDAPPGDPGCGEPVRLRVGPRHPAEPYYLPPPEETRPGFDDPQLQQELFRILAGPRSNPDEPMRELERRAALGDLEARARFEAAILRAPRTPEEAAWANAEQVRQRWIAGELQGGDYMLARDAWRYAAGFTGRDLGRRAWRVMDHGPAKTVLNTYEEEAGKKYDGRVKRGRKRWLGDVEAERVIHAWLKAAGFRYYKTSAPVTEDNYSSEGVWRGPRNETVTWFHKDHGPGPASLIEASTEVATGLRGWSRPETLAARLLQLAARAFDVKARNNPDERMRELERRAALGDVEAQQALDALRARSGLLPKCDYCLISPATKEWLGEPACSDCYEVLSEAAERECSVCGSESRVVNGLCAWCRADENDRPFGTCPSCGGARDRDGTCACRPRENPDERIRDLERRAQVGDREAAEQLRRMQWRSGAGPAAVFSGLNRGDWVGIRLAIKTKHGESKRFHRRWIAETPTPPARFYREIPRLRRVALIAQIEVGPQGSGAHQGFLELHKNGQVYWWHGNRATRVAELRLEEGRSIP